jgi:hypothetical protein
LLVPVSVSPERRSLNARIAANTRWSREDPVAGTAKARRAFLERFIDEVDPERLLADDERYRRAQAAMRAHMLQLSLRSAKARSKDGPK